MISTTGHWRVEGGEKGMYGNIDRVCWHMQRAIKPNKKESSS